MEEAGIGGPHAISYGGDGWDGIVPVRLKSQMTAMCCGINSTGNPGFMEPDLILWGPVLDWLQLLPQTGSRLVVSQTEPLPSQEVSGKKRTGVCNLLNRAPVVCPYGETCKFVHRCSICCRTDHGKLHCPDLAASAGHGLCPDMSWYSTHTCRPPHCIGSSFCCCIDLSLL